MGYNFVVFDDVVWENNNQSPDFEWLRNELLNSSEPSILMAHIPPWTDQLEGSYSQKFGDIIAENNVMLSLHGHQHDFALNSFRGIPAIVSGSIDKHIYTVIKVFGNDFKIERINF
jgi:predicted phosphohydrolase